MKEKLAGLIINSVIAGLMITAAFMVAIEMGIAMVGTIVLLLITKR